MTKRCGCIVYLNRYEGVPIAAFERAWSDTKTLDELPDADFVRLVPEARDSWIIMDPDCIVGIEMVDRYDATLT